MATVLLIEDDVLIQKAVTVKLKKEGFEVKACSDGKEGMEAIDSKPDIILTDLMLPYFSGLEIVTKAKQTDHTIPVIVFSSMGQEAVVEEAFELGADDYITKPFSLTELSIRIKKQLKNR